MIEFTTGDILRADSEALVNTVNCVGVMGRGIALQFKRAYPDNFRSYAEACKLGEVQPGRVYVFETGQLTNPRYIINFPTKRHWRGKSRIEDIELGLEDLALTIRNLEIQSIAIPPLGSGLGRLEWTDVRSRIIEALQAVSDVHVLVFEPRGAPSPENMSHIREVPSMTVGRAALVELIRRYLAGLLDPFVSLLEVHKLMYFLQEAGEPLRLRYNKGPYGPYAENLRHVLNAIEGHFLSGYADGGDRPDKRLTLVPGVVEEAADCLNRHEETRERFERVSHLVDGFESPFGLELLSTVHWIMKELPINSLDSLVESVHSWDDRKLQFTPRQIAIAARTLSDEGWAEPVESYSPA